MIPRFRPTGSQSGPSNARSAARCLLAATLAFSVLAWPSGAAAQDEPAGEEIQFEYGIDGVSWYWSRQIDETLELGEIVQPIELPNPQSATTMPVAVEFGEASKVAALQFNLMERGVPEGADITEFTLTVAEGDDTGDSPTFNPAQHLIQACPITEAWSSGEAEMWDVRPPVGDDCVEGERSEPDPEELTEAEGLEDFQMPLPTWTFDLSELAEDWAVDHFANYGVMFMPVLDDATPIDLWQVNLKLPLRDDAETETDEYEATVDRLAASFAYEPPAETEPAEDTGGAASGGASGGGGGGGSGGGGSANGADAEAPAEEEASAEELTPAAYEPIEPRMPWYVWTLIPAGLVGAYILHTLMGGTAAPAATRGAIDRIRSHNLARRGWSMPVPAGLFERLTGRGGREAE